MGLKYSPESFCRILNQVLIGLTGYNTHVYLDDIVIHGIDLMDNIDNLGKVFLRLLESKLKVNLKKCVFFKTSVKYLGHIISAEGLKPQPNKIETINKMPTPKTVKELQSYLGMTNYYRKCIQDYAGIAAPLNKLTEGHMNEKNYEKYIEWNKEAEEAFVKLKRVLSEQVTLIFPEFEKSFYLTTDASNIAIGGVLQQKDEYDNLRPLTFFSRK